MALPVICQKSQLSTNRISVRHMRPRKVARIVALIQTLGRGTCVIRARATLGGPRETRPLEGKSKGEGGTTAEGNSKAKITATQIARQRWRRYDIDGALSIRRGLGRRSGVA